MQIKRLEIEGLYGYIDKIINFKKDISLLVGINGSGKTSILNIVNWLVKPSMANLSVTEFKRIKLSFDFKGKMYEVTCVHNKTSLKYSLKTEGEAFHPLTVQIKTNPKLLSKDENLKNSLFAEYAGLSPNVKEEKTWEFLKTVLPNPTIIGLDRNLFTEEAEKIYIEESLKGRTFKRSPANISPLDRVKEIVNTEYRKRKNEILRLTNRLKNRLMLSAFEGNIGLAT